jgi:hypothetical protein
MKFILQKMNNFQDSGRIDDAFGQERIVIVQRRRIFGEQVILQNVSAQLRFG